MSVSELYATQSGSSLFSLSFFIQSRCFDCHCHLSPVFTDIIQKSSERKYKNIRGFLRETMLKNNLCSTFVKAYREVLLFPSWHWCVPLLFSEMRCILGTVVQSNAVLHCFPFTCPFVQHQVVLQRRFDVSGLLWAECKYAHRHGPGDCTGWQLARHLHTKFCLCSSGEKKFGVSFHLSD